MADKCAQEEAKQIIERAQLEEEELVVQRKMERKWKQEDKREAEEVTQGPSKVSAMSKQQWKEHLGLKAKL